MTPKEITTLAGHRLLPPWVMKLVLEAVAVEREAIAQMFDDAPKLITSAQNSEGGCLICGFTPKIAAAAIRARGEK